VTSSWSFILQLLNQMKFKLVFLSQLS